MAVSGNSSDEKTGVERIICTGIATVKILAVNPTLEELNAVGVQSKKEPTYIGENSNTGANNIRLDFWVEAENGAKHKIPFWIENTQRVSKKEDHKKQWINKYGRTTWAVTEDSIASEYFLKDNLRHAYQGEEELHFFLQNLLNVKYDTNNKIYDECQLEDIPAIISGDMTEIRAILSDPTFKDNTIRTLWGASVTDKGTYQTIYNRHFEKTWGNINFAKWQEKAIDVDYSPFTAELEDGFNFVPYVGSATAEIATADAETTTTDDNTF